MSEESPSSVSFSDFSLNDRLLEAIEGLGFETPTPIQAQAIPFLQQGRDLIGQAQTGTGKTAAFGLPLLGQIDTSRRNTQALILAPTRELAIQVARALKQFAAKMPGLLVTPIYGGQEYGTQLKALRKGSHIVVGTPGRVMDHIRRGSLKLDGLKTMVLDEADEMLSMGFVEDIEWVLGHCPDERQTILFSATMPSRIRSIAKKYMQDPQQVIIEKRTSAATTIRQRHWVVAGLNKLDALSRILEAETLDAVLIFVRTKASTVVLAEQLAERHLKAAALHGDMPQSMREHTVKRLERGQVDLLVATDVAARGLDIERFSHVVNYDMPGDPEAYVHRIGRTGRAGRVGNAISFVVPRERYLLRGIERITKQPIEAMKLPSADQLNRKRITDFKQSINQIVTEGELDPFIGILRELCEEESLDPLEMAAALAQKAQGKVPLLVRDIVVPTRKPDRPRSGSARPQRVRPEQGMARYRLAVGLDQGAMPSHIVGAIANSSGLQGRHIGRITINQDHSLVDLPEGMPNEIFQLLKKIRVCQIPMDLSLVSDKSTTPDRKSFGPKNHAKRTAFDPKSRSHQKTRNHKRRVAGKR